MTSGDEPMLSGLSDDAPMISSIQTRAIADARGAYIVGNLAALYAQMTEQQQVRFRQCVVRVLVSCAERNLEGALADVEIERRSLELIRQWAEDPSDERANAVLDYLLDVGAVFELAEEVRAEHDGERYLAWGPGQTALTILPALSTISTRELEDIVSQTLYWFFDLRLAQLSQPVRYWMLDVAWAVLQGREGALLEDFVEPGPQGAYRLRDCKRLLGFMRMAQQRRFRQALVQQAIQAVERILPAGAHYTAERQLVDAARRWLDEPTLAHLEAATHLRLSYSRSADKDRAIQAAAVYLVDLIWMQSDSRALDLSLEILKTAARRLFRPDLMEYSDELAPARWWQIEAAWAILNHQEPPPFPEIDSQV